MRSPNKVEKLAYLYGPTYYTPKIKICGISKVETILAIVDAKPDYMGLVFAPSKRQVTVDQAKTLVEELHKQYANRYNRNAEQYSNNVVQAGTITDVVQDGTIINALQEETATGDAHEGTLTSTENISPTLIHQEFIKTVGIFVNETLENLVTIATEVNLDAMQLHGDEDEAFIQSLKERTNVEVWKAVQIRSAADAEAWIDSSADMLLFDAYHKDERGGTGEVFDWSCLDEFERPFMLAGGIDSTNVARAIRTVRPYGIDISSGIETDGVKDNEKITAFTKLVRTIAMP